MSQEIIKKLSLTKYNDILVEDMPDHIREFDDINSTTNLEVYDAIITFVFSLEEFKNKLLNYYHNSLIKQKGRIFFVYPKKTIKNTLNI